MAANIVTVDNLGPEFDVGSLVAGKIRLKLGDGLAIALDGTISAIKEVYCAMIVNADGSILSTSNNDVSVSKIGTGRYQINHNSGVANLPSIPKTEEGDSRDDVPAKIRNGSRSANSFEVYCSEQDNGATAGVYRDRRFSLIIYNL